MSKKNPLVVDAAEPTPGMTVLDAAGKSDESSVLVARGEKSDELSVLGAQVAADAAAQFAAQLSVDLGGSMEDRADSAVMYMNRSHRNLLAAGLLLCSIKQEAGHGRFGTLLKQRGFEERAARRAMQYATFMVQRQEDERTGLMKLPKVKVALLANADPEVVDELLEEGSEAISRMTVRELRDALQGMKGEVTSKDYELKSALTRAEKAERMLRGLDERPDGLPHVLAAVREEVMAHAGAAGEGVQALGEEVRALMKLDIGEASPTLVLDSYRLALGHLAMLAMQVNGLIGELAETLPEGERVMTPEAVLSTEELDAVAARMRDEVGFRNAQKAHRTDQRARDAQKGPGRPRNVAPAPTR